MAAIQGSQPAWVEYSIGFLNNLDPQIDEGFPQNILQTKIDTLSSQIKEKFASLPDFNYWLQENNATEWYTQLATYLVKLPPKAALNAINGLYNIICQALYLGVHPVAGLNSLAKSIILLLNELMKSENWAKIGAGSLGALTAQGLILGGPVTLIGLGIGGALLAGGITAEYLAALSTTEEGRELDVLLDQMRVYAKQLPESFLTGVFSALLFGGIKRAFTKPEEVRILPAPKPFATPGQSTFERIPDVAQYKWSDWSNLVKIEHGVTLEQAKAIANSNSNIDYFFYMKAGHMVLESEDWTSFRIFERGDAVFFSGEPWWGSAPGFSDGYVKI